MKMKLNWKLLLTLTFFVIFYSFALDKYPLVWVDEPWLAEASWNWIKIHKFVNLTFTGYYGFDILEIGYPFFHLLLALVFKIFGLKIIPARALSVLFSLFTLITVYYLVKQIYDNNKNTALLAVVILIVNPVFFQCSREIRQESIVTFLIVLSFYLLVKAVNTQKLIYYFICGISSGLGILTHYNMSFVILTLFLMIVFKNKNQTSTGKNPSSFINIKTGVCYLAGVFIITMPWIIFILINLDMFNKQVLLQCSSRVFFIKGILSHILSEYKRWVYPSVITPALFGFASVFYLAFKNYKKYRLLLNYIGIFIILLCMIDGPKVVLYSNLIFPFLAIATAISYSEFSKNRKILAAILLTILLSISGIFLPYKLYKALPSDYYGLTNKFKEVIPKNSVVIGQPTYWFGLEADYRFRSYDLPYYYIDNYKVNYKNAIKLTKADYLIFDNYWGRIYKGYNKEREDFIKNHCILVKTITDKYYGQESDKKEELNNIKIYKVKL